MELYGAGIFISYGVILCLFTLKLYKMDDGARLVVLGLSYILLLYLLSLVFISTTVWISIAVDVFFIYTLQFHGPTKAEFQRKKEYEKRKLPKRYQAMLDREI